MKDLHLLSARRAAAAVASKEILSVELVEACLDRIDLRESSVNAWACIDRESVLREAIARDREPIRGPLHGVPIGVKDVFDTQDLPTEYGSSIYRSHQPQRDAASVAMLRRAGGIILGKTVTTEFALYRPGPTKNPHNLLHTPGGSSSGSAAAVADFHVPIALGTQTSGSIIRPAAFCGVVGYKPSFNTFIPDGLKPLAASLDTVGMIARSVDDLSFLSSVLQGNQEAIALSVPSKPRIGLCRTPYWNSAQSDGQDALLGTAERLANSGFAIEELALPDWFESLSEVHSQIMAYEIARNLIYESEGSRQDMLHERTHQLIEDGWDMSHETYLAARSAVRRAQSEFTAACQGLDAIMVPAAPGEAPLLSSTGDPVFNRVWTLLGVPAVTLPVTLSSKGLPLGVQFVGPIDSDRTLLSLCRHIEEALGSIKR